MSTGPSRLIYVDDTSPLISYQGAWGGADTYPGTTTQLGRPFNDTLHGLPGSGSFSLNFTGSSVSVIGSFPTSALPSWTCFIDGFSLISNNITSQVNQNNVDICSLQNIVIKPTPSNLTVVALGTSDSPFLFDHVRYAPSASTILDNATVVVDAFDDQIHYDSGWSPLESVGMQTSVQGGSMTFDFVGDQITWITTVAFNSNTTVNSTAQYSIDNGALFPIQVAAHNSTIQTYDLVSFQTPKLTPGSHRLFVQFGGGNDSAAPLVLDHLIIQNFTIPTPVPPSPTSSTSSMGPSTTPASAQSPTSTQSFGHARLSKGAIGGIVIGTLVGLTILFIIVIRVLKRKSATTSQRPGSGYSAYGDGL